MRVLYTHRKTTTLVVIEVKILTMMTPETPECKPANAITIRIKLRNA